jgi:hypothetical protein
MALFDTGTGLGNLFQGMNIFGAKPSEALTGVLGNDQNALEKLKNQSLLQGIIGTGATYFAQPKNQNIGLGAILAKSYLGGMGQSQNAYDAALKGKLDALNYQKTQKELEVAGIPEFQRLINAKNALDPKSPTYQADLQFITNKLAKESTHTPPVVVNTGDKADVKFAEKIAVDVADRLGSSYSGASEAINTKRIVGDIQKDISNGIYAGPGSTTQTTLAQVGTKFGIVDQDVRKAAERTAATMQNLAKLELEAAKGMKGQGSLTEGEREILRRAAGGQIDKFNSNELSVLVGALDKTSNYKIQSHQELMRRIPNNPSIRAYTDIYNLQIPEGINVTPVNTSSNIQPPKANVKLPGGVIVTKVPN